MSASEPERRIIEVRPLARYTGLCDAGRCHLQARWLIRFDTGARLMLCPRHSHETAANYAKAHRACLSRPHEKVEAE